MELETLIAYIPEQWQPTALAVVALLISVRTVLRAGSAMLRGFVDVAVRIDVALDGVRDWPWPARLARVLDWIDAKLDWLPVKAPFVRSKKP